MSNGQDGEWPNQYQQQGSGQPWLQEQWPPQYGQPGPGQHGEQGGPWQREQYDPSAHRHRLGQPPQPPYPPQGQPWAPPGYQPPQGPPGWQQPGYGQQPPWGTPPGPPQPPRRKRHTTRNVLLSVGALVAAIIVIAVSESGGTTSSTGASAASSGIASGVNSAETAAQNCTAPGGTWNGTSCQAPAPSPSNTPAAPTKVEFIVSGTAPDGIDITYGPDGSQLSGPSTLDGTATMSVPFDGSANYYAIDAQLQGDGSITCKIVVTGPGDSPLTVSSGAASGSYNICSAQAAPTDSTGLSWTNEE